VALLLDLQRHALLPLVAEPVEVLVYLLPAPDDEEVAKDEAGDEEADEDPLEDLTGALGGVHYASGLSKHAVAEGADREPPDAHQDPPPRHVDLVAVVGEDLDVLAQHDRRHDSEQQGGGHRGDVAAPVGGERHRDLGAREADLDPPRGLGPRVVGEGARGEGEAGGDNGKGDV